MQIELMFPHLLNESATVDEKEETQPLMMNMNNTSSTVDKSKLCIRIVFLEALLIMNLLVLLFEIMEVTYVTHNWTAFSKLTVVASSIAILLDIISFVYLLFCADTAESCFYLFLQLLLSCFFAMFRVSFYNDLKEESYRHALLTKIDLSFNLGLLILTLCVACLIWLLDGCRCKQPRTY